MKNKLIFRILGALSSALIIVSVFVPFVKVTGFSQSLWQTNINTLYLPIIIIVFGAIGVLLFAINLKTELAYSTTGALLFFLISQTIPIINQGTFSTLNVGYYFLVVGTLLTGIMTFLCGIKTKQKPVEEVKVEETKEDSMISQIDRLYENQTVQTNETEINQVEMIQPLQSIESLPPIAQNNNSLNMSMEEKESESENLNDLLQPAVETNQQEVQPVENNPIVEEEFNQPTVIEEPKQEINNVTNPVVSEFEPQKPQEQPIVSNPVVSEFAMPQVNEVNNVQQETPQPSIQNQVVVENAQPVVSAPNPVVSEFEAPSQFNIGATEQVEQFVETTEESTQTIEPIQPLQPLGGNIDKVDVMADPTTLKESNSSNLDIFG